MPRGIRFRADSEQTRGDMRPAGADEKGGNMEPDEEREGARGEPRRMTAYELRRRLARQDEPRPRADNGKHLGTIAFSNGAELRARWIEDAGGPPFLSLWVWHPDENGEMWPEARRGLRLRWEEVEPLARSVARALDLADAYRLRRKTWVREHHARRTEDREPPPAA